MPASVLTCVCCARTFRPPSGIVVVCPVCIEHFVMTGEQPGAGSKPLPKTPPPPKVAAKPASKVVESPPALTIVHYPTPPGICANLTCKKPFEGYTNQRYCSITCRFAANDARRAAREAAREATA